MNIYCLQLDTEFTFGQWIVTAPTEAEAKQELYDSEAWIEEAGMEVTCIYLAKKPFVITAIVRGGFRSNG